MIDQKYAEHDVPDSPGLRRIFEKAIDELGGLSTWRAFGDYLHALREHDPRFTGRALKNIADSVSARMMDFDLPDEWLEKRDAFFGQPYEKRVAMISELRGEITPEMVLQEIHRYADSEARYGEAADARELEERTRQMLLDGRARESAALRAAAERES